MIKLNVELIETTRKGLSLTQAELSSRIGISQSHYSLLKEGLRLPSLIVVEGLWRELNLPIQKILIKKNK